MAILENFNLVVYNQPPEKFAAFRDWFAKFDAEVWDLQFKAYVTGGKLDALADKAIQDLKEGRCTQL